MPTLLVIEPAAERPVLKWLGSLGVADLERLLDDGARAVRASRMSPAEGGQREGLGQPPSGGKS